MDIKLDTADSSVAETNIQQLDVLRLNINRPLYEHENLRQNYEYEKTKVSACEKIKRKLDIRKCDAKVLDKAIPAIKWLREYNWRTDLTSDIIAGLTIGIMQIPLGMACAIIGNMDAIYGLYIGFFPVLIYAIFCSSRHASVGGFAVTILMTGKVVSTYATVATETLNTHNQTDVNATNLVETVYTPVQVATTVSFLVGIIQLIMCGLRLGVIASLFSETFVNGFTTASAIYVLVTLMSDMLGISIPPQKGYFKAIRIIIAVFSNIQHTNIASLIISSITVAIILLNNFLKPWVEKKSKIPVPIEIIVMVIGIIVTYYCNLSETYDVAIVGTIPTGLPEPALPAFDLLPSVIMDSISIAMIGYTITMSLAFIFAQKGNYNVDSNQELFAMACSNIFGSFFSCMPISAALSRSTVQYNVGGKTQLTSIISCIVMLSVLLWIAPVFECLPKSVLAAMIVVSLKGMFFQVCEFKRFWKLSKYDAIVWLLTFSVTIIISTDLGLLIGLITAVTSILIQSVKPRTSILGVVPNTELFLEVNRYKKVSELKGIKIFHYSGSLNFINEKNFRNALCKEVNIMPEQILKEQEKRSIKGSAVNGHLNEVNFIIIDMSAVTFIDPTGVVALHTVAEEFQKINIPIYLAACSTPVFNVIKKCATYTKSDSHIQTFATIHDAVQYCQTKSTSTYLSHL